MTVIMRVIMICLSLFYDKKKAKGKVGFLYSAAHAKTGPARFTISEVAVD